VVFSILQLPFHWQPGFAAPTKKEKNSGREHVNSRRKAGVAAKKSGEHLSRKFPPYSNPWHKLHDLLLGWLSVTARKISWSKKKLEFSAFDFFH
jgi:hypothetical protein